MTEDILFDLEGVGENVEMALEGNMILTRHIATRASKKQEIIVLTLSDGEYQGYSIGLDECSLQLLEIGSGDVVTLAVDHIVAIKDGRKFDELSGPQMTFVERKTASFGKTSQNWLVKNWPNVYDKRDSEGAPVVPRSQRAAGRPVRPGLGPNVGRGQMTGQGFQQTR